MDVKWLCTTIRKNLLGGDFIDIQENLVLQIPKCKI